MEDLRLVVAGHQEYGGAAAGPALGGLIIATAGIAVPFWIFAASNAVIIAALIWWRKWRKPRKAAESLPPPHCR